VREQVGRRHRHAQPAVVEGAAKARDDAIALGRRDAQRDQVPQNAVPGNGRAFPHLQHDGAGFPQTGQIGGGDRPVPAGLEGDRTLSLPGRGLDRQLHAKAVRLGAQLFDV